MIEKHEHQAGFTLTELLIVVAIVGILAAVGYPSYQNFVRESKRSDAHAALTHIAAQQERFFANNNAYATALTNLGYASATPTSPEGYWQISITTAGAPAGGYLLTAAPAAGHTDADCATITIASTGVRGGSSAECW